MAMLDNSRILSNNKRYAFNYKGLTLQVYTQVLQICQAQKTDYYMVYYIKLAKELFRGKIMLLVIVPASS